MRCARFGGPSIRKSARIPARPFPCIVAANGMVRRVPAETQTSSVATQVRDAQAARRPVRIIGAGTWRHAFNADAVETIDTSGISGIVEYVPGDLTITVKAGTTLAEIDQA